MFNQCSCVGGGDDLRTGRVNHCLDRRSGTERRRGGNHGGRRVRWRWGCSQGSQTWRPQLGGRENKERIINTGGQPPGFAPSTTAAFGPAALSSPQRRWKVPACSAHRRPGLDGNEGGRTQAARSGWVSTKQSQRSRMQIMANSYNNQTDLCVGRGTFGYMIFFKNYRNKLYIYLNAGATIRISHTR